MADLTRLLSALRDAAVAPATRITYTKQLSAFLNYSDITPQQLVSLDAADLDLQLAHYIAYLHSTGRSYTHASHALNGLVFQRPEMRLRLGISHQALRGWGRLKPTRSYPPITWELTVLFAVLLAREGHHAPAVGLLLAFDCYLRVSEMTRIRYCDVVMPNDPRTGQAYTGMAVALPLTKTGLNQWVTIKDPAVGDILLDHIARRSPQSTDNDRVFPFTPARFRRLLTLASVAAGVGYSHYVPHSLRHGGATADFLRGVTIEQIMFRGRWKGMESARRYLQTGRAMLAAQRVPLALNQLGIILDQHIVYIMHYFFSSVEVSEPQPRKQVRFL